MNTIKLRNIAKPAILKRIGRTLLARLFATFQADFPPPPPAGGTEFQLSAFRISAFQQSLPPPELSDDNYFRELAALLMRPESLPGGLTEALCAIDEMSTRHGFAALEADPDWPAKRALIKPASTREEIALQLWLADPDFLARVHNRLRLRRLTSFEHATHPLVHQSNNPPLHPSTTPPLPSFPPPDHFTMYTLSRALDDWFVLNGRGSETTRIEIYPIGREHWFLIRHGDLFTRAPKVEQQQTHILHFRPERDDVVVYSPALDELRVNARTQGERDLYFREFGLHLRGSADYFSNRSTYTLEPLRAVGPDALDPRHVPGVEKIRLRELETADPTGKREVITRAEQGLFEFAAASPGSPDPIPKEGHLARAIFEIQFTGSVKSHPVEIRLPNILKVSRHCDTALVQDWLTATGFRRAPIPGAAAPAPTRRPRETYLTPQLI